MRTTQHSPNRKTHYDCPLVHRPKKTRFAYLLRGMAYLDANTAQQSLSALQDDELVSQLWKHVPKAMREATEFPPEALDKPYPFYTRVMMEALVKLTYAEIRASRQEWTDRERVVRTIVAAQTASDALSAAKATTLLNEGDRAQNGLTRYSIQSVWKTFRAALKAKRWDFEQLASDVVSVRALLYLEDRARNDKRFRTLRGEELADAIEQHTGIAKAVDRACLTIFPQLVQTCAQKRSD